MASSKRKFKAPMVGGGAVFAPPWMGIPYFAKEGEGILDGIEHLRGEMERRWGVGRLRLVVDAELRAKFDRQVDMLHAAVHQGTIEALRAEGQRMVNAWRALDRAALLAGELELNPEVWEVQLADGRVIALVQTHTDAKHIAPQDRQLEVWTLEEVARLIVAFPTLVKAKELWPGAEVVSTRTTRPKLPPEGDEIPDFRS